jgi:chromodomain-helicase-DNA-binding protein 4
LPVKHASSRKKKASSDSDTDFQADTEDESEPEPELAAAEQIRLNELGTGRGSSTTTNTPLTLLHKQNAAGSINKHSSKPTVTVKGPKTKSPTQPPRINKHHLKNGSGSTIIDLSSPKSATKGSSATKPFRRAQIPIRSSLAPPDESYTIRMCPACFKQHPQGACELKIAGVEHCGLCGLAHYGYSRTCPHIKSETQVRAMLEALRNSNEPKELVEAAAKYLRGVKGTLVQQKKRDREKAAAAQNGGMQPLGTGPQKSRAPGMYAPNAAGYGSAAQFPVAPPTQFPTGLPQREVPSWYNASHNSSHAHSRPQGEQQKTHGYGHSEQEVESALRGFLGH